MRLLILLFLILPQLTKSQTFKSPIQKVHNVYRRDAKTIHGYNLEYYKTLKNAINLKEYDDSIAFDIVYTYEKKSCFDNYQTIIHCVLEAKDNRSRISYTNYKYNHNSDNTCPKNGEFYELIDCNDCEISINLIKEDLKKYIPNKLKEYHTFLAEKSKDGKW